MNRNTYIAHAGVKGMSWGNRNEDTLRKYGLLKGFGKKTGNQNPKAPSLGSGGGSGDEYDNWDDIPEDPNNPGFIKMPDGTKVYKAEDGTAFVIDKNGKYHHADSPTAAARKAAKANDPDANNGKRYERFSQLSEDEDHAYDYVVISGRKVYKAEDGTATVEDSDGNIHGGKTPGEAIKKAQAADNMSKVRQRVRELKNKARR